METVHMLAQQEVVVVVVVFFSSLPCDRCLPPPVVATVYFVLSVSLGLPIEPRTPRACPNCFVKWAVKRDAASAAGAAWAEPWAALSFKPDRK